jgi:hypothetical protein
MNSCNKHHELRHRERKCFYCFLPDVLVYIMIVPINLFYGCAGFPVVSSPGMSIPVVP